MWHRASGGFVVSTSEPGLRIESGDWSTLTLDVHAPKTGDAVDVRRMVVERGLEAARTQLRFAVADGKATLNVSATGNGDPRAWVLRLHLRPGQRVAAASLVGVPTNVPLVHLTATSEDHFPFGGIGAGPARFAGPIAEVTVPASAEPRQLELVMA
jgi:hypothetical protein